MGSALKNLHSSQEKGRRCSGRRKTCLFAYLSLSQNKTAGRFLVTGFLRKAFYHMDLETAARHTVCLWLLLILSWNYLESLLPSYYAIREAVTSKRIHNHLGVL